MGPLKVDMAQGPNMSKSLPAFSKWLALGLQGKRVFGCNPVKEKEGRAERNHFYLLDMKGVSNESLFLNIKLDN